MADLDSVRVAVRIRPLSGSEKEKNSKVAVEKLPGFQQIKVNRNENFSFNFVFDENSKQEEVYKSCVSSMLDKLFEGFNATILAYGQTGSGKTFTMGTHFDGNLDENVGVIPRAMLDIFERIEALAGEIDFNVKCSFMELYNEQLFDLLSNKPRLESIVDMREDRTGIIIPGLTEETVTSTKETTDFLAKGSAGRAVASTAMNEQSSRSHAIFTLCIQATKKTDVNSVTTSKFHLVDLAGSERSKKTKASGDRFKEGIKINQSLMVLGKVISALGTGQGSGFVCYRDSKLTRFLQDSLGGNSYTLMIACVSPAEFNVDETLSTLRYADNARKIKNKPIVNQDPRIAEINFLKNLSRKLYGEFIENGLKLSPALAVDVEKIINGASKGQVLSSKEVVSKTASVAAATTGAGTTPINSLEFEDLQQKYNESQSKCLKLQQTLQMTLHDLAETEMKAHLIEASNENLQNKVEQLSYLAKDLKEKYSEDEQMQAMLTIFSEINKDLQNTQTEISEYKIRCSVSSDTTNVSAEYTNADVQEKTEAFTNKQSALNEALRRIDRELSLKQQLHDKVKNNFYKMHSTQNENENEEQMKEFEKKIKELESEKSDLQDKLKNVKDHVSAKLAEERRKRLQELEQQIVAMKRKVDQQAKLLKVKEKEAEKIQNLNSEIRSMKESKVKLIREMRKESEKFRLSKIEYEKKVIQLKNKDRKMQAEMSKKEALHNKQRNVLKRKCEEAMAVNKRLKDALERQSAAQAMRHKVQANKITSMSSSAKLEQFLIASERELEIITSVVDAKFTLEQLIEYRVVIKNRIHELAKAKDEDAREELKTLREDLELRNAEIADLQQKVNSADLEGRIKNLVESIQNVSESKAVLENLVKVICDIRRENAQLNQNINSVMEEHRAQIEASEGRYEQAENKLKVMAIEYEEKLLEKENNYEDKIAVLLRELHKATEMFNNNVDTSNDNDVNAKDHKENKKELLKIQEEQLNKMESLREELEYYKKLTSKWAAVSKNKVAVDERDGEYDHLILDSDDEDEDEDGFIDNVNEDPDWRKTPLFKRNRSNTKRTTNNMALNNSNRNLTMNLSDAKSVDETFTTATNDLNNLSDTSYNNDRRRKMVGIGCKCRGKCVTKRCVCLAKNMLCTDQCKCTEQCQNNTENGSEFNEKGGFEEIIKENMPPPPAPVPSPEQQSNNLTELIQVKSESLHEDEQNNLKPVKSSDLFNIEVPDTSISDYSSKFLTPKRQKLSTLSFNTPSVNKKKFFMD